MTTPITDNANPYVQICIRIIKEQANIIGTFSWDEAEKVKGLTVVDRAKESISITEDPKQVIDDLVERYVQLFGRLSRDVSRESVSDLTADIPDADIPSSLKKY